MSKLTRLSNAQTRVLAALRRGKASPPDQGPRLSLRDKLAQKYGPSPLARLLAIADHRLGADALAEAALEIILAATRRSVGGLGGQARFP